MSVTPAAIQIRVAVFCRFSGKLPNTYGNGYSNLLDYVISASLIFNILTVAGLFRLHATRPEASRPYLCWGYPWLPAGYILGSATVLVILFAYRPATTWSGLLIVLSGVSVYLLLRRNDHQQQLALETA